MGDNFDNNTAIGGGSFWTYTIFKSVNGPFVHAAEAGGSDFEVAFQDAVVKASSDCYTLYGRKSAVVLSTHFVSGAGRFVCVVVWAPDVSAAYNRSPD